jgi:hypothetical protein
VRRHEARAAGHGELAYRLEHDCLVAEVEAGHRFIHDQDRRALREGAGDQDQLLLAATQLRKQAIRHVPDAEPIQSLLRRFLIGSGWTGEGAEMDGAAHQNQLAHGIREPDALRLRHIGHCAGNAMARP